MTPSSASRLYRHRLSRFIFIALFAIAVVAAAGSAMGSAGVRVKVTAKPKAIVTSGTATFRWSTAGKVLHTKCSIDAKKFAACKKAKSYKSLKDGLHRFRVEVLGSGSHKMATVKWRIDRKAATIPSVSGGSTTWQSVASVTVTAAGSTDAGGSGVAGYQYRTSTDGGTTWSAAAKGASVQTSAEGEKLVEFRSVDKAGNLSAWTVAATVRIDRSAPAAPDVSGGSTQHQNAASVDVTASGGADTGGSGFDHFAYRTSTDGGTTWSIPVNGGDATVSAEGQTLVQFAAVDAAGNESAWAPASATDGSTVWLDRTIPTSPSVSGAPDGWQNLPSATLTASGSTDAQGGSVAGYQFEVSTDGGVTWGPATSGTQKTVSAEGQTLVRFRSFDSASPANDSAWSQAAVELDRTNPGAPTVGGGSTAWQNVASVDINASGSTDAGGSGLDHYEYRSSEDSGANWTTPVSGTDAVISAEGQTQVEFRAVDGAGNTSGWVSATAQIDRTAPSAPTVAGGSSAWQNPVSVDVNGSGSTDAGSGVDHYEYRTSSTNGSNWSAPTTGTDATVATDGTTLVQFRAVDGAGNASAWTPQPATAQSTVKLDHQLPTLTAVTGGSLTWKNIASVTITSSGGADTGGSGFAHYDFRTSADGGNTWTDPTAGSSVAVTDEGETLVQFRAVDGAGNTSAWFPAASTATSTVRIDRSAPTAPAVAGGSSAWQNAASVTLTASGSTDTGSGVAGYQYRTSTDGGTTWSANFSGTSVTVTAEGETLVQFRAMDVAGRASSWVSAYARLDRSAPSDPTVSGGSATWKSVASITVTPSGSVDNGGSGLAGYLVRTSTNGGNTWTVPVAATAYTVTAEGDTLVSFEARDTAGNTSNWVQTDARIDRTAPTNPTSVTGGSASWQALASVPISASGATDSGGSGVGYQYRTSTDGTNWSAPVAGASDTVSAEGITYVQFRAIDGAGNAPANWVPASTGAGNTVKLDRAAPSAPTVSGGSLSWHTTSPVVVSASASTDGGSGLAGYDYRTSTDGGTSWSPVGTSANVSVSAQGTTIVQFRSRDVAGNVSAWTPAAADATNTVMIDTVAPTLAAPTGGSTTWTNVSPIVVSDVMSDATSGIKTMNVRTSANGTTWTTATPITSPSLSVKTEGTTYIEFQAVDNAGNTSAWTSSVAGSTAKLDLTAPSLPTVTGGSGTTTCRSRITISAAGSTDAASGLNHYDYRVSSDGINWGTPVLNARSVRETVKGTYYLQFRADDKAGNSSAWAPLTATAASIACIS